MASATTPRMMFVCCVLDGWSKGGGCFVEARRVELMIRRRGLRVRVRARSAPPGWPEVGLRVWKGGEVRPNARLMRGEVFETIVSVSTRRTGVNEERRVDVLNMIFIKNLDTDVKHVTGAFFLPFPRHFLDF